MQVKQFIILGFFFMALLISSCKKEDISSINHNGQSIADTTNNHHVEGSWNSTFEYSLSFFTIDFALESNSTGIVNASYNETGGTYDPGTVLWEKYDTDSIRIYFEFPAYPSEGWLLKGIINEGDSIITGNNYQVEREGEHAVIGQHGVFTMERN